jgi:hypothetical protein
MSHPAKRPYAGSQPRISSYFLQSPSSASPTTTYSISHLSPTSPADTRSPPLPPSVQANLLSVGMRVRKSVPEGYKTGTAFSLFSDPTPIRPPQEQKVKKTGPRPRARELTPFCGIMKVGGLAQQQQQQHWEVCDLESDSAIEEEEDELPALSQGSTNSDVSVASRGGSKRRFDLDEEDEIGGERDIVSISGRRIIAVPRRKGAAKLEDSVDVVGQENLDADVDFGEADFLDYALVDEVEMSGV